MAKNKKTNTNEDFVLTPVTEEQGEVKKWKAGKYRYLKNYFGSLGEFKQGEVYEFNEKLATIFGNAGEIEKC